MEFPADLDIKSNNKRTPFTKRFKKSSKNTEIYDFFLFALSKFWRPKFLSDFLGVDIKK